MNELVTVEKLTALAKADITQALIETNDFGEQYLALKAAIDYLKGVKEDLDAKISGVISPLYNADGTSSISNDRVNFTYCAATTSLAVDTAKLKESFPDVYKQCVKTQNRKASLRVTERKSGEDNV